jgi:hypothetical protein
MVEGSFVPAHPQIAERQQMRGIWAAGIEGV